MRPVCEASLETCEVLLAQQHLLRRDAMDGKNMLFIRKSSDFQLPAGVNALQGGPMRVGDLADVRLPATRDGMYHLVAYLCRGWHFGIVQLHPLIATHTAIRRYLPREGRIVRVAGTDHQGNAGLNGPPERAQLRAPRGLTVSPSGIICITDSERWYARPVFTLHSRPVRVLQSIEHSGLAVPPDFAFDERQLDGYATAETSRPHRRHLYADDLGPTATAV